MMHYEAATFPIPSLNYADWSVTRANVECQILLHSITSMQKLPTIHTDNTFSQPLSFFKHVSRKFSSHVCMNSFLLNSVVDLIPLVKA